MARCHICKVNIPSGKLADKRIEERAGEDGLSDFYGFGLPQQLGEAKGPLRHVYHPRCYFARYKRETKFGDADHGNISGKTSQELADSGGATGTVTMTEGLPREREKLKAERMGGTPYAHTHMGPVADKTIGAHLEFAHGFKPPDGMTLAEMQVYHRKLHAKAAQEAIASRRAKDSTADGPTESNWRDSKEAEI